MFGTWKQLNALPRMLNLSKTKKKCPLICLRQWSQSYFLRICSKVISQKLRYFMEFCYYKKATHLDIKDGYYQLWNYQQKRLYPVIWRKFFYCRYISTCGIIYKFLDTSKSKYQLNGMQHILKIVEYRNCIYNNKLNTIYRA